MKQNQTSIRQLPFWPWIKQRWPMILMLGILVGVVYLNTLDNEFVSDDIAAIQLNPRLDNIHQLIGSPIAAVSGLSRFVIFKLFGAWPLPFRLTNIIFHLANVVLIYFVIELLLNHKVALITATLFAVHPIQTESVTWISGGFSTYSSFFVLISLIFFIKSTNQKFRAKQYCLSLLAFFIGMGFWEKNMGYPAILVGYLFAYQRLKKHWSKILPFFGISLIWIIIYVSMIPQRIGSLSVQYSNQVEMANPLVQIPVALSSYVELIAFPKDLTLYHSDLNMTKQKFAVRVAITLSLIALFVYGLFKNRQLSLWLGFFVVALSPTLTPFGISSVVAERYVYLGTLGIYVLIALGLDKVLDRINNAEGRQLAIFGWGILVVLLMGRSIIRNQDWQNQDTLWLAAGKTSPNSAQNNNNLGDYYGRYGNTEMAIYHFKRAIELNPQYADAHHNLANTYVALGEFELALENYQKAAQLNPNLWQSYQQMAAVYYHLGNTEKALENINQALTIYPENQVLTEQKAIILDQDE